MSSLQHVRRVDDLTMGHHKALVTHIGGLPSSIEVLQGTKVIVLQDVPDQLFNKDGTRFAFSGTPGYEPSTEHISFLRSCRIKCDPREAYKRYVSLDYIYSTRMRLNRFTYTVDELKQRLRENRRIAHVLNGPCLPIIVPHMIAAYSMSTRFMPDEGYLKALKEAKERLTGEFELFDPNKLLGSAKVVDGSGQGALLDNACSDNVVALFFPGALWYHSHQTAINQLASLPPGFALAGLYETAMAYIMHTEFLVSDSGYRVPLYVYGTGFRDHLAYFDPRRDDLVMRFNDVGAEQIGSAWSAGLVYYSE